MITEFKYNISALLWPEEWIASRKYVILYVHKKWLTKKCFHCADNAAAIAFGWIKIVTVNSDVGILVLHYHKEMIQAKVLLELALRSKELVYSIRWAEMLSD